MIFAYLYSVITVKCNYPLHIRKFKKAWYFPIRFFLFHFSPPKAIADISYSNPIFCVG